MHAYGTLAAIAGGRRRNTQVPILKLSFKQAEGGLLIHGFLAKGDAGAAKMQTGHAEICPAYGPEFKKGNTIETELEVDDIPAFDAEAIDEWLDEMFGLDEEEDEEEIEDGEHIEGEEEDDD